MAYPTSAPATLRPDLGGSMMEFDADADRLGFIGPQAMPVIETAEKSGSFGTIPLESLLFSGNTERAPKARYPRGDWDWDPQTFNTQEHGWEEPVDDNLSAVYSNYFDMEMIAAVRARGVVLRNYEARVAAAIQDTGTFTNAAVTAAISTSGSATPIADVQARAMAIYDATGIWPDTLIINKKQFKYLREVDEVLDKIKYVTGTLPGEIGVNHLRDAFDLPKILIASGAKNTANAGQSASISSLWSDSYIAVCKTADTNNIEEPCVGRTLHWGGDGSQIGSAMESYRDETVRGDVIRARMQTQEKILYSGLCQLLTGVLT